MPFVGVAKDPEAANDTDPASVRHLHRPAGDLLMSMASAASVSAALALASLLPATSAEDDLAQQRIKARTSPSEGGSSMGQGTRILTASRSKSQFSLGGNGSLVRAGSGTQAVMHNDTDLSLAQGVTLTSSGRRVFGGREAVSVDTPETRTTVRGTMLVAYQPRSYIKITCIEGQATVKLKGVMGEFVTLHAGEMVIINPAEKRLPNKVEVDLDELTRTCSLLGPEFPELGSAPRIARAVDRQARGIDQGDAMRTPLVLTGAGLEVTLSDERGVDVRRRPPTTEAQPGPELGSPPASWSPSSPPFRIYVPSFYDSGPEYVIDSTTRFIPSSPSLQTPGLSLKQGLTDSQKPTAWEFPDLSVVKIPELLLRGDIDIPSSSNSGDVFLADGIYVGAGLPTRVGLHGPLTLETSKYLLIDSARIGTAPGASSGLTMTGGWSIDVYNSAIEQTAHINAHAPVIRVERSTLSADESGIQLKGSGISITNSSELLSMAASVDIGLHPNGSHIAITDSEIRGRNVLIEAAGPSGTADGLVEIRNSVINGDTIRARAFRSGGDRNALVISGSTFNANNAIKFYAEGAARLVFQGDVKVTVSNLSSGEAVFAGRTVQADNGATVNVNGNLRVFRDTANYNRPGFGRIDATGQRSDQAFDARPPF